MRKHPTQEQYINLLKEQRRNSRRAISRCTKSIKAYEKHLYLIEEAEEVLIRLGIITENDKYEGNVKDKCDYHENVERVNMMSGKTYSEPINTPACCSPASETYWSI